MPSRRVRLRLLSIALLFCALVGGPGPLARAETASPPFAARSASPKWHVTETENFRLLTYGLEPVAEATAADCERVRERLMRQWLGASAPAAAWAPKCDLILHASDAGYDREVGPGGRSTIASALVRREQGRIVARRIDVRGTRADWQAVALAHELSHVVLADRFDGESLPRWLDEGMAILADSRRKRRQHLVRVRHAVEQGAHFRLAELLLLSDYPPADRWGTFYDQSASVVEFLVAQRGREEFVQFVDLALTEGYDRALQVVYDVSLVEMERRWHRSLRDSARASS